MPDWVEQPFEDGKLLWATANRGERARAMQHSTTNVQQGREDVRAWTEGLGTFHHKLLRAVLVMWWWDITGEARIPTFDEVRAAAETAC